MVVQDPLERALKKLDVAYHLDTLGRVAGDADEVRVRDAAGLAQDARRDGELADVVQQPGVAQGIGVLTAQSQGLSHQIAQ